MPSPLTRALRLTALATPLVWAVAAPATALATTPVGWEEPPSISTLSALLLFVGVPLALFLLIVGLTVAPSLARSGDQQQNLDRWATPQWFHGPAAGADRALPASRTGGHELVAAGTRSVPSEGSGATAYTGGGHGSGSSAYSGSAPGSGSSAYTGSEQGSDSSASTRSVTGSPASTDTGQGSGAYTGGGQAGSSTYEGSAVGQGQSRTHASPSTESAGSKAHLTSGNAPESGAANTYASPGAGVPAEGDQLAAAATRGGGASARW